MKLIPRNPDVRQANEKHEAGQLNSIKLTSADRVILEAKSVNFQFKLGNIPATGNAADALRRLKLAISKYDREVSR